MIDRIITAIVGVVAAFVIFGTVLGVGYIFFGGPCPKNPMCFEHLDGKKR